jgi:glycerophosphodiester phosphodiesterase
LVTAASLGAEYVEFDVQLTKDLVPVIYHDWVLSETGLNIPVNAVTLEEFHSLGPQKKKRNQQQQQQQQQQHSSSNSTSASSNKAKVNALLGTDKPVAAELRGSRSDDDSELYSISQRRLSLNALDSLNHRHEPQLLMTIDGFLERQPKYRHHGGRGDVSIKAPFATLKETLTVRIF